MTTVVERQSVRIAPSLGPLKRAEARMTHPFGDILVRLERSGDKGLRGEVMRSAANSPLLPCAQGRREGTKREVGVTAAEK
jgi:hypothetical protein